LPSLSTQSHSNGDERQNKQQNIDKEKIGLVNMSTCELGMMYFTRTDDHLKASHFELQSFQRHALVKYMHIELWQWRCKKRSLVSFDDYHDSASARACLTH
jgi:hypothetical protein